MTTMNSAVPHINVSITPRTADSMQDLYDEVLAYFTTGARLPLNSQLDAAIRSFNDCWNYELRAFDLLGNHSDLFMLISASDNAEALRSVRLGDETYKFFGVSVGRLGEGVLFKIGYAGIEHHLQNKRIPCHSADFWIGA